LNSQTVAGEQSFAGAYFRVAGPSKSAMMRYKKYWDGEIARCKAFGLEIPNPVPQSEDISVDMSTGTLGSAVLKAAKPLRDILTQYVEVYRFGEKTGRPGL
jgi:allantoicase